MNIIIMPWIAVVPAQPMISTKPEYTFFRLFYAVNNIAGQAIIYCEIV